MSEEAPKTEGSETSEEAPRARYAMLPLVLLIACGAFIAWEIWGTVMPSQKAARPEDWIGAIKRMDLDRGQGEPVLFAPHWVVPVGLQHAGKRVDLPLATLSDVDRYPKVWELSIRGAQHPFVAGQEPKIQHTFGRVTLSLYQQKPAEVLFDFYEQLHKATVSRIGNTLEPCPLSRVALAGRPRGPKFRCDKRRSWNWVGWYLAEVGHQPYSCIYAHPVDRHTIRVAFDEVPLGEKLVLYTGIDDFDSRKRAKAPVMLSVFVGDKLLGSVKHLNHWPWRRSELDSKAHAGKKLPLRFEITSPLAYSRPFCFRGEARRR